MAATKRFPRKPIEASANAVPRVMNMDKNPAYPAAVELRIAPCSLLLLRLIGSMLALDPL